MMTSIASPLPALSPAKHTLLQPCIGLLLIGFVLSGLLYCAANVLLAQLCFPWQANGSLLYREGKVVGSALVGQSFSSEGYVHGRPSYVDYVVSNMAGSNLAISNPELTRLIAQRRAQFSQQNGISAAAVPLEMLAASGSGIDPDISVASAALQLNRIAKARGIELARLNQLLAQQIHAKQWQVYGQARVNVLAFNLALAQLSATPQAHPWPHPQP
jgi:K+-transporting ATPase ATPase C chain